MTRRIPDIDDLIGSETDPRERERLARVHGALTRADAPPELPSSLKQPPDVGVRALPAADGVRAFRRPRVEPLRRRVALAAASATVALAAGGAAYLATAPGGTAPEHVVAMRATAAAPLAQAKLWIGARDHAGNWPVTLSVRDLPRLVAGSYYEMFLTDRGRLVGSCGTFRVDGGTTVVHLNVPYRLGEYSGWVIRREPASGLSPAPALLTT